MIEDNDAVKVQASDTMIEVRGRLSRTDWELVYLAAHKFAREYGLSIERFDLQSAELDEPQRYLGNPSTSERNT
jgi:hypothetical protein